MARFDMETIEVPSVAVFGIGGTSFRQAVHHDTGEMGQVNKVDTPQSPEQFMQAIGQGIMDAYDVSGCELVVSGFPGPVDYNNGRPIVGPMENVPALSRTRFDLVVSLSATDPTLGRMLDNGDIRLFGVNDGVLAVQAAAHFFGRGEQKITSLINGSGIGGGSANLLEGACFERPNDQQHTVKPVYVIDDDLEEYGKVWIGDNPANTVEKIYAIKSIEERLRRKTPDISSDDLVWLHLGRAMAKLTAQQIALIKSPDVLVYSGGSMHSANKWVPHLEDEIARYTDVDSNSVLVRTLTTMRREFVPANAVDTFELFGAAGLVASILATELR
jgi:predicted NBD/HSP70 family sugar kinase